MEDAWLGMLAIAAIGVAGLGAAALVRPLTRAGASRSRARAWASSSSRSSESIARAGRHAALGGRFDLHGAPAITHWAAAVASTVFVLVGVALAALALFRSGRRAAGVASAVAAAATLGVLLATGGQSPGVVQRVWIVVMTVWLAGVATVALTRD